MRTRVAIGLVAVLGAAVAAVAAVAGLGTSTGTSSSQSPYLVPSHESVELKSIITVGDPVGGAVDGYRMVGIPDGLGAIKGKGGTFTLLMNHELGSTQGGVRAHGAKGAFVSTWEIGKEKDALTVLSGGDLIQKVAFWNTAAGAYDAPVTGTDAAPFQFNRFCSADLPDEGAFYDKKSKAGFDGRLFMNGEEAGTEGRAFAHGLDGTSWELPALGKFSWENSVTHPSTGAKTVVVGLDDSGGGQVYVYVGEKKKTGNPAELAGLTGGKLYGIKVTGMPSETLPAGIPSGTPFTGYDHGNVTTWTGAQLESASVAAGVTGWARPEDGAWDPKNPRDFFFVTTASFSESSKLYRLRFVDPADPARGGTVTQLLTGSEDGGTGERFHMLDNIGIDRHGRIVLQEDPGGQNYLARVWLYDIESGSLTEIARHDPVRFHPDSITRLTIDEESSGVIDAEEILGKGWWLLDVQAHYSLTGAQAPLVQGGQLLAMHVGKIRPGEDDA